MEQGTEGAGRHEGKQDRWEGNMREELKILYEDTELIVCHKPAGLAVQSAKVGQKDMVSVLNNYLAEKRASGRNRFPEKCDGRRTSRNREEVSTVHVVHRLDQPVEGVLVFAKNKRAAAGLSRQVTDGSMEKIYRAVCCVHDSRVCIESRREEGQPGNRAMEEDHEKKRNGTDYGRNCYEPGKSYCLVDYLVKDGRTNSSFIAEKGDRDAKRAELSFRIVEISRSKLSDGAETEICAGDVHTESDKKRILAEIKLKTGRHHQIRVQMAHAGLPLYGDRKYNERWKEFLTEKDKPYSDGSDSGKIPLALCAISLAFTHPATGKRMSFQTEPNADVFRLFAAPVGQRKLTDQSFSGE